jgi:hypothetical protein
MVVVLQQPELSKDNETLVEAVRIYVGNLGCDLREATGAPLVLDSAALERLRSLARDWRADYLLWTGRGTGGGGAYYALDAVTGDVRETEIGSAGSDTAAEEVALKIRALLSSRRRSAAARAAASARAGDGAGAPASGNRLDMAPAPPARGDASPDASPPPVAAVEPDPNAANPLPKTAPLAPAPAASVVAQVSAPTSGDRPAPRPARVEVRGGFGFTTPRDRTWLRSGLVLDVAARLGARSRAWAYVEGALTTRPSASVRGFEVTLQDVPFTAGLRLRIPTAHGAVALGSRTGLHILDVTGVAPDGRAASSRSYALGLGAGVLAEVALSPHLKASLGVTVEGLLPSQQFTVGGQPAVATGAVLYGATAGLALSLP